MDIQERRRNEDRRVHHRGGRRPYDRPGHAPLVFVVTRDSSDLQYWEALLLDRHFAVVPCNGPGPALDAFRALRPDVIVASSHDIAMLRDRLPFGRRGLTIPLVEFGGTADAVEPVIEDIRRVLGATRMARL